MRLLLVVALAFGVGCGGLFPRPDAGASGGGSPAGGGTAGGGMAGGGGGGQDVAGGGSAGGGSAGGGSAGGGLAGGGSAGGGSAGGGSSGPWQYASLSMPTTVGGEIRALGGNSTVLYAGTAGGRLFRHVLGQAVTEVTNRTNTAGVVGLWVSPTGAVFLASSRAFSWCSTNCELGTSYTDVPASDLNDFHAAVCGASNSEVYVPSLRGNNVGVLYRWNGSMLQKISNDLGVASPSACVVMNGVVHIAAQKHFARFEQNSVTVELADLSTVGGTAEQNQHYWYGIGTLGSQLVGVGSRQRIAMRQTNGTWSMPFNPQAASATLYVVGGPTANEGYALGTVTSATVNLVTYASGTWMRAAGDLPFLGSVRGLFVAGPNEMYFGGADGSGAPTLVRARR